MTRAVVALPAGSSVAVLSTALSQVPEAQLVALLDGGTAILEVPDALVPVLAQLPGIMLSTTQAVPDLNALNLAPQARSWLEGWNQLRDPARQAAMSARAPTWLSTDVLCEIGAPAPPPAGALPTLTATVAIGMLVVDGPAEAQLQPSDFLDITAAALHAFDILYRNAPPSAHLVFLAEQRRTALTLLPFIVPAPVPGQISWEQMESREHIWRDPALQALGLQPGFSGIDQYRNQLMTRSWATGPPQKAIVAVFTKYNTAWFAYAANGRFVLQLPWATSQVGPNNIDRVIAHEVSHLFGALDEYQPCSPASSSGPFGTLNANCVINPFLPQAPCLMNGDSEDMCVWTKAHVGWQAFP
jgi:hypothetical protein